MSLPAQQISETVTPLDRLSALMKADMDCVNGAIYARMQSDVPLIPQLAGYLIASGGKRMRPLLTLAATRLFDAETPRCHSLAAAVEFIHTATLLHDDVVDESEQRRGKTSANLVFGNQETVLVGDFLFSRAFELMVEDGSIDVLRILSRASAVIAEGEVLQLSLQGNIDTSIDDYSCVIAAKTAALFAAACEIGPVIAGQNAATQKAMRDYGHHLGMAFQIADDVLDYSADAGMLGKDIGDDFREGKMTAPVILALEKANDLEREFWTSVIGAANVSAEDLECAQALIKGNACDVAALEMAWEHAKKAVRALETVQDGILKTALIDAAFFAVDRKL